MSVKVRGSHYGDLCLILLYGGRPRTLSQTRSCSTEVVGWFPLPTPLIPKFFFDLESSKIFPPSNPPSSSRKVSFCRTHSSSSSLSLSSTWVYLASTVTSSLWTLGPLDSKSNEETFHSWTVRPNILSPYDEPCVMSLYNSTGVVTRLIKTTSQPHPDITIHSRFVCVCGQIYTCICACMCVHDYIHIHVYVCAS